MEKIKKSNVQEYVAPEMETVVIELQRVINESNTEQGEEGGQINPWPNP